MHRTFFAFLLVIAAGARAATSPTADPKRIINDSANFLKEREPEMTEEEKALYDKVQTMLTVQPAFAVRLLEGMSGDAKPSPAFDLLMGNAYYNSGRVADAEVRYRRAVDRYPSFLRAWDNLGVLYYAQQKYPAAIAAFSKAVALGDRDPTSFGLLGYCLEKENNGVAAEVAYLQAIAGAPENADWSEALLRIYLQGGMYPRAEALADSLIRQQPDVPRYWLQKARVLLATGRKLEAMGLLEQTVALGIAGQEETDALADLYAEAGLYPEAIAAYRKLIAAKADVGEAKILRYARMLITARDWAQADALLERMSGSISPAHRSEYLQARADVRLGQKQWPEAGKLLAELLRSEPMNGPALLALGRSYAAQDQRSRALLTFEAASHVSASAYAANIELANLELKNRHYDDALSRLETALNLQRTASLEEFIAQVKSLASAKG